MVDKVKFEIDATVDDIKAIISNLDDQRKKQKTDVRPKTEEKKDPDERQILLG